jgi:hypothetical protein
MTKQEQADLKVLQERVATLEAQLAEERQQHAQAELGLKNGFSNALHRIAQDYGSLEWLNHAILERFENVQLHTHMAERSDGLSSIEIYRQITKDKLEIDYLQWFAGSVKRKGYEYTLDYAKRRYDIRKTEMEERWKSKERKNEEFREDVTRALLEKIEFYCRHKGYSTGEKFKEAVVEAAGDLQKIRKLVDGYMW